MALLFSFLSFTDVNLPRMHGAVPWWWMILNKDPLSQFSLYRVPLCGAGLTHRALFKQNEVNRSSVLFLPSFLPKKKTKAKHGGRKEISIKTLKLLILGQLCRPIYWTWAQSLSRGRGLGASGKAATDGTVNTYRRQIKLPQLPETGWDVKFSVCFFPCKAEQSLSLCRTVSAPGTSTQSLLLAAPTDVCSSPQYLMPCRNKAASFHQLAG